MSELEQLAAPWLAADSQGEVAPSSRATLCMGCGKFVDDNFAQFFMTTYPGGEERQDYWGIIHPDCRPPVWLEKLQAESQRVGSGTGRPVRQDGPSAA